MRRIVVTAAASLALSFFAGAASASPAHVCPIGSDPTVTVFCLAHPCTTKICPQ